MEGRTQDKKDSTINTFRWLFFFPKPEQESHNSSKNATPFYLFGFFYQFLQQSHVSAGPDGFYHSGPHQPV